MEMSLSKQLGTLFVEKRFKELKKRIESFDKVPVLPYASGHGEGLGHRDLEELGYAKVQLDSTGEEIEVILPNKFVYNV